MGVRFRLPGLRRPSGWLSGIEPLLEEHLTRQGVAIGMQAAGGIHQYISGLDTASINDRFFIHNPYNRTGDVVIILVTSGICAVSPRMMRFRFLAGGTHAIDQLEYHIIMLFSAGEVIEEE